MCLYEYLSICRHVCVYTHVCACIHIYTHRDSDLDDLLVLHSLSTVALDRNLQVKAKKRYQNPSCAVTIEGRRCSLSFVTDKH